MIVDCFKLMLNGNLKFKLLFQLLAFIEIINATFVSWSSIIQNFDIFQGDMNFKLCHFDLVLGKFNFNWHYFNLDRRVFELQLIKNFDLFLSANVRHSVDKFLRMNELKHGSAGSWGWEERASQTMSGLSDAKAKEVLLVV